MKNGPADDTRLSKSRYISGLQCPKLLWWLVREPDAPELEVDPAQQFIFDRGAEVGRMAHSYVPGGVEIESRRHEHERRLRETAAALLGGAKVLYEPAFDHDGVTVVPDILERSRKGWTLIEVKSSTKVKPEHLADVSVQTHVLRGAGLEVRRTELMHLNRECKHPDLSNLFEREDLTAQVEAGLAAVPGEIGRLRKALAGPLPQVEIGDHCHEPYECPFLKRCWPEPLPHAVSTLYRLRADRRDAYERKGYRTILDLPDGERLTSIQERQRAAARSNGLVVGEGLRESLEEMKPPYAYLDFETVAPPIPVWTGCRPYDPVPVQLSVHRQTGKGALTHDDWLADGAGDPRETVARKLIEFTAGAGSIVAYNAAFERGCIEHLKEQLPHLASELKSVTDRLHDLLPVVRDHVYHPGFNGSFGLKSVIPHLVPEVSYATLEIAEGAGAAQRLYDLLIKGDPIEDDEKRRIRRELLLYCGTDTEALARLHQALARLGAGRLTGKSGGRKKGPLAKN